MNKLRTLRANDNSTFETLKLLLKTAKGFERTSLPKGVSAKTISELERYGFVFIYHYRDYVLLNNRLKTLIDKI
jgi:hypothetical protein